MVEIVVTDEEKEAASYLDWDDAALGRFAKYTALRLTEMSKDSEGLRKVAVASCAMMMVSAAHDSNATTLELKLSGHTSKEIPTGDWKIVVKRTRKPSSSAA